MRPSDDRVDDEDRPLPRPRPRPRPATPPRAAPPQPGQRGAQVLGVGAAVLLAPTRVDNEVGRVLK